LEKIPPFRRARDDLDTLRESGGIAPRRISATRKDFRRNSDNRLCDESLSTCVERVTICVVRRDE
jgi:hypothetical protein